jgi:hypothetical protein
MSNTETFITQNLKYLPRQKHQEILTKLNELDENKAKLLHGIEFKNPTNWLLCYLFIPFFFLIDSFLLGQTMRGLLKILIPLVLFLFASNRFNYGVEIDSQNKSALEAKLKPEEESDKLALGKVYKNKEDSLKNAARVNFKNKYGKVSDYNNPLYWEKDRAERNLSDTIMEIELRLEREKSDAEFKITDKYWNRLFSEPKKSIWTGLGFALMLVSGASLGIWTIIDIFTIQRRVRDKNLKTFYEVVG